MVIGGFHACILFANLRSLISFRSIYVALHCCHIVV